MSNQEFENYLMLVGKLLQLSSDQREQLAGELRDHLELRVDDLVQEGATHHEATTRALEEFGDAAVMAQNFQSVNKHRKRRWMMRFATLSTAGLFLATILTMAMWPNDARFGTPEASHAQSPQDGDAAESPQSSLPQKHEMSASNRLTRRAELALEEPCDFNYDETAFSDIMAELSNKTELNFVLTNSAEDDLLSKDELVTIRLHGLPLSTSLSFLLKPFNATYCIDRGVVLIISLDDADQPEFMRTRMYDCKDLVEALPKRLLLPEATTGGGFESKPKVVSGAEASASTGATPQPNDLLDSLLKEDDSRTRDATLLNLVYAMVDSDSWEDSGTGLGRADVVNGVLIVNQSQSSLSKIDDLLKDLRGKLLNTD